MSDRRDTVHVLGEEPPQRLEPARLRLEEESESLGRPARGVGRPSAHFGQAPLRGGPLQLRGGAEGVERPQEVAQRGLQGSAQRLPYLETIQAAFGEHDVSGVSAFVGGPAAQAARALGAQAYATGSAVAFRESPSLHTAAHEAAHVVQQRAGVHLKDGVGRRGDAYEQHADAVADKVVSGGSAAALLAPFGVGGAPGGGAAQTIAVQREDACYPESIAPEEEAAPEQAEEPQDGVGVSGGFSVSVDASLKVPLSVPGLSLGVELSASATSSTSSIVEVAGNIQLALEYKFLFITLRVFAAGGVKLQVRSDQEIRDREALLSAADPTDAASVVRRGIEEIGCWFAARELENIAEQRQEIQDAYERARQRTMDLGQRLTELRAAGPGSVLSWCAQTGEDGLTGALRAIKEPLKEDIREIFADVDAEIDYERIIDETYVFGQAHEMFIGLEALTGVQAPPTFLEVGAANGRGLQSPANGNDLIRLTNQFEMALHNHLLERQQGVAAQMDPALIGAANDPDVGFELSAEVGVGAGVSLTRGASVEVEQTHRWQVGDQVGQAHFDTAVHEVDAVQLSGTFSVRGRELEVQLAYEQGEGGERKVSGAVTVKSESSPNESNARDALATLREQLRGLARGEPGAYLRCLQRLCGEAVTARSSRVEVDGAWELSVEVALSWGGASEELRGSVRFSGKRMLEVEANLGNVEGEVHLGAGTFVEITF